MGRRRMTYPLVMKNIFHSCSKEIGEIILKCLTIFLMICWGIDFV